MDVVAELSLYLEVNLQSLFGEASTHPLENFKRTGNEKQTYLFLSRNKQLFSQCKTLRSAED